jgi:hypothetical protein
MAKITLGKRPKHFKRTLTVPMLEGGEGQIEISFIYRTRTEFGAFVDGLFAAAGEKPASAADEDVAFSLAKSLEKTRDTNADYILNIATDTYTVEAQLSSGETASPASFSTVVTVGAPVFVGTFTVSGASGFIAGSVSLGGVPLKTGVVIVASTATIVTPPTINAATLMGTGYFLTSSYENGSYVMEVRGSTSTSYNVYAYYPTYSAGVWTNTVRSSTSVSVLPGFTKSGVSFTW